MPGVPVTPCNCSHRAVARSEAAQGVSNGDAWHFWPLGFIMRAIYCRDKKSGSRQNETRTKTFYGRHFLFAPGIRK